ncbi:MAG TPA: shikimate dehydrogenase [Lachnospiraceae bacterium]|nr:shikimate dehydrogenase [Lachnospiraceae bacterium]
MISINGKTRTCGLVGNPVEHTLSPMIHNTLASLQDHNLVYIPFLVEKEKLIEAIKGAFGLNILGMNVTIPYKSDIIPLLCEIDELAENIGAVNTLVRMEDGFKGYNTDMLGLLRAMNTEGILLKGEDIIILGAGGAARAVAFLCASNGAHRIFLLNRTLEKAEQVANEVNHCFHTSSIVPMKMSDHHLLPDKHYLAIQGTSVGLSPNISEAPIEDKSFYKKIHTGYDLIYNPVKTKFMSNVEQGGGRAFNGLKMLLYQGVIAYELWNQVSISESQAEYVYIQMMKEIEKKINE